jgi:hypothetical protein
MYENGCEERRDEEEEHDAGTEPRRGQQREAGKGSLRGKNGQGSDEIERKGIW